MPDAQLDMDLPAVGEMHFKTGVCHACMIATTWVNEATGFCPDCDFGNCTIEFSAWLAECEYTDHPLLTGDWSNYEPILKREDFHA